MLSASSLCAHSAGQSHGIAPSFGVPTPPECAEVPLPFMPRVSEFPPGQKTSCGAADGRASENVCDRTSRSRLPRSSKKAPRPRTSGGFIGEAAQPMQSGDRRAAELALQKKRAPCSCSAADKQVAPVAGCGFADSMPSSRPGSPQEEADEDEDTSLSRTKAVRDAAADWCQGPPLLDESADLAGVKGTTFMVRNLSRRLRQSEILQRWSRAEYDYDLLYLPYDENKRRASGYVFMNFVTHESAALFRDDWHGKFSDTLSKQGEKPIEVRVAQRQGFDENVLYWQNSLREIIDEDKLPAIFPQGERCDFRHYVCPVPVDSGPSVDDAGTQNACSL